MPGARFETEFIPVEKDPVDFSWEGHSPALIHRWSKIDRQLSEITEKGTERAQFLLSANSGEMPHPLHKVASGGELSRIMLALKKAMVADAETCILVFDEIDSGISGRVADVVGRKLRELAGKFQIICISHLPQVAVYADTHFLVQKMQKTKRTESVIEKLSDEESAAEIARLLSGKEVSKSSLENAKALIGDAKSLSFKGIPPKKKRKIDTKESHSRQ
jgi:DNA repair protein RecN (Recombination protein N)